MPSTFRLGQHCAVRVWIKERHTVLANYSMTNVGIPWRRTTHEVIHIRHTWTPVVNQRSLPGDLVSVFKQELLDCIIAFVGTTFSLFKEVRNFLNRKIKKRCKHGTHAITVYPWLFLIELCLILRSHSILYRIAESQSFLGVRAGSIAKRLGHG